MTWPCVKLPEWLDAFIYTTMKAPYCPLRIGLEVKKWSREEVLLYLGTYFPRSFAEAYRLFSDYFMKHVEVYGGICELSAFDIGCGTGGELVGLLLAIDQYLPSVERVRIKAHDGNPNNIPICEMVLEEYSKHSRLLIDAKVHNVSVDDACDANNMSACISGEFDFVISFKMFNEIIKARTFGSVNPYECIANAFTKNLSTNGKFCIADVVMLDEGSGRWLSRIMDDGLSRCGLQMQCQNSAYYDMFSVSHSQQSTDGSKLTWKIFGKGVV